MATKNESFFLKFHAAACAKPVQNIKVANITIHEKYNRDKYGFTKGYDIALIRLEKPAKMFTVRETTQSRQGF